MHLKGQASAHNNNFGFKQLSTNVKSFINKALEYKANLNLKLICIWCYAFLSDESLFVQLICDVIVCIFIAIYRFTVIQCSNCKFIWRYTVPV